MNKDCVECFNGTRNETSGVHTMKEIESEVIVPNNASNKWHTGEVVIPKKIIDELKEASDKVIAEYQKQIDEIIAKESKESVEENADYTSEIKEDIKKNGYMGYNTGTQIFPSHFNEGDNQQELVIGKRKSFK